MSNAWFCPSCQKYHAPHVETCPGGGIGSGPYSIPSIACGCASEKCRIEGCQALKKYQPQQVTTSTYQWPKDGSIPMSLTGAIQ